MWVIKVVPVEGHIIEHRICDWHEVLKKVQYTRSLGWAIFVERA